MLELEGARQEIAYLKARSALDFLRHRPLDWTGGTGAVSDGTSPIGDGDLVDRVCSAYKHGFQSPMIEGNSFWLSDYAQKKRRIHDSIMAGDIETVAGMLRNPQRSPLFYGFDLLNNVDPPMSAAVVDWQRQWVFDNLVRLAEAVGVTRLHYPEAPRSDPSPPDVEEILSSLDAAFGFRIDFPNPFPGEAGLSTSRGIASYRSIQSLYQVWRISQLTDGTERRVVEIGGGLGRNAYYASKFGFGSFSIVDLPMTSVAQGYYLGRVLGGDRVRLQGEHESKPISLLTPEEYLQQDDRYDLILNVDSLSEMSTEMAVLYLRKSFEISPKLLSINHEYNPYTFPQLLREHFNRSATLRTPYWMRNGYVEELVNS